MKVREKSLRLTSDVYRAVAGFPREELSGLTSQPTRSASSVPSSIAEGCGRDRDTELARFGGIATGSVTEPDDRLLLAHDLGFLDAEKHARFASQTKEVQTMLVALVAKLREPRA